MVDATEGELASGDPRTTRILQLRSGPRNLSRPFLDRYNSNLSW